MRRLRFGSSLVLAIVLLGACGGSSYKGLTKAEFIKQAEAVCKSYDAQLLTAAGTAGANPTIAQVKTIYQQKLIPLFRKEVDALRALKPPKADRATMKKIFDDLSTGIGQTETAVASSKSLAAVESISPAALTRASNSAKAYGLTTCGKS